MLVLVRRENPDIYDVKPIPSVARLIGALTRFCRTRLLELTVGGLLIVWWLAVFRLWVSFLQEASLFEWPR